MNQNFNMKYFPILFSLLFLLNCIIDLILNIKEGKNIIIPITGIIVFIAIIVIYNKLMEFL